LRFAGVHGGQQRGEGLPEFFDVGSGWGVLFSSETIEQFHGSPPVQGVSALGQKISRPDVAAPVRSFQAIDIAILAITPQNA
jgi:hypothetical protein